MKVSAAAEIIKANFLLDAILLARARGSRNHGAAKLMTAIHTAIALL